MNKNGFLGVASMDVDSTNSFTEECPDELPVIGGTQIVGELNAQASLAYFRLGSKDCHSEHGLWRATPSYPQFTPITGYPNLDQRWKLHSVIGTFGFELIKGLPPVLDYDFMAYKGMENDSHPYGACYHDLGNRVSTGIIEWLTANEVHTVIVGGLAMDYCVLETVLQLRNKGFRVILNKAASRALTKVGEESAIAKMERSGALVAENAVEVKEILKNLNKPKGA